MKLLVTGGCGFLGSNLVADALRRGVEVTVLDNLSRVGADRNRAWLAAQDRKSTRLNSSHSQQSRMPSSA